MGSGYRAGRRVFFPFDHNEFIAFWTAHYGAEKLGCEVVPGGVLDIETRILKMRELMVDAFLATPTYVLATADTARNKLGIDQSKDLQIQRITVAEEPGGSMPATKKGMEDAWGAKLYDHIGATEISTLNYECVFQSGIHINEAFFLVEFEDPVIGELITKPGRQGTMIITALDRMDQPCLRFDSKDLI